MKVILIVVVVVVVLLFVIPEAAQALTARVADRPATARRLDP